MHEILLSLVAGLIALLQQAAQPAKPEQAAQVAETRSRFEQALTIRTADRGEQPLKVSLRDWVVRNRQTATLKAQGMLVIHVRAGGPVITLVDGQRAERQEDEFFVVAAGKSLSVETGNDTVVFTVLEVQR